MKCPECKRKMIFNRDIKDYYCTKCKSSLEELLEEEPLEEPEEKPKPKGKDEPKEHEAPAQPLMPQAGTLRGLLFMMIGSIILIISSLILLCQILEIVGLFLLILGFFIIYRDRENYPEEHRTSMKLAAFFIALWIALRIVVIIMEYIINMNLINEIEKLSNDDFIPRNIIVNFVQNINYLIIISPLVIGALAIGRFLTLKNLIEPRLKIILAIIVPLLILSGFLTMYVQLDITGQYPDVLEETTKDEFYNEPNNITSKINQNEIILYSSSFLSIAAEAMMILCFYWAYTYQRSKSQD